MYIQITPTGVLKIDIQIKIMYNKVLYIMKSVFIFIPAVNKEIQFIIGNNAKENFDIIDSAKENDIWFHINNEPSCHVIAIIPINEKLSKKQLSKIVVQGACICKNNSKFKSCKNVEIIHSNILNVAKTQILGKVNVINGKHIVI